jgi:hypothetical protein
MIKSFMRKEQSRDRLKKYIQNLTHTNIKYIHKIFLSLEKRPTEIGMKYFVEFETIKDIYDEIKYTIKSNPDRYLINFIWCSWCPNDKTSDVVINFKKFENIYTNPDAAKLLVLF